VATNKVIPNVPAFHGSDDTSFAVPNSAWGNGAEVTVSVMVGMADNGVIGGPNVDTVTFAVGVGAGVDPPEANGDTGSWDLRDDDTGFSLDVLANDTADRTLSAIAASGDFTLDGDDTVAGTYT